MIKIGSFFLNVDLGGIYMVARIGNRKCTLININSGNCWSDPVDTEENWEISEDEFNKLTNGNTQYFEKVTNVGDYI